MLADDEDDDDKDEEEEEDEEEENEKKKKVKDVKNVDGDVNIENIYERDNKDDEDDNYDHSLYESKFFGKNFISEDLHNVKHNSRRCTIKTHVSSYCRLVAVAASRRNR